MEKSIQRNQTQPMSLVYTDKGSNLFIGGKQDQADSALLEKNFITAILSITDRGLNAPVDHAFVVEKMQLEFQDSDSSNIIDMLGKCAGFIETQISAGRNILVHCEFGRSRSVSIVVGFLALRLNLEPYKVLKMIKEKRSCANPIERFMDQLCEFYDSVAKK